MVTGSRAPATDRPVAAWRLLARLVGSRDAFTNPATRRLALAFLATSLGQGGWVAANVLLFQQTLDLDPVQFGLARTVAAVAALTCVLPLVTLADRYGSRRLALVAHLVQAAAVAAMYLATGFLGYLALLAVLTVVRRVADTVRTTLSVELAAPGTATRQRAALRSLSNLGFAVGSGCAAAPLALGGDLGLAVAVAGYTAATLAAALALPRAARRARSATGVPEPKPEPGPSSLRTVLADRPFLAATAVTAVFSFADTVLTLALPLWLALSTKAPTWTLSPLLVLNTVLVVLLQARLVRADDSAASLRRYAALSGLTLAVGLLLYGLTTGASGLALWLPLLAGTVALTLTEIFASGLLWGLPVLFAPPTALNAYHGVASSATTLRDTLGPLLVVAFLTGGGPGRWPLGAAVALVAGAVAWSALTRRPPRGGQEGRGA